MKVLLLALMLLTPFAAFSQIVNIPDPNFKAALLAINGLDENGDGEIQISEAEATYSIIVDNSNISDLTGIEAFINVSILYVSFNNLTTVDLSQNTNLVELLIEFNELESLDVSTNERLIWLWFSGNNISEIDLSHNPDIELLWASNNELASIDVSQIPRLASLSLGNNMLTTVDVTSNAILSHLTLEAGNLFTELDLSQNPLLCTVVVGNNSLLEYINLKNGSNHLLVEGNVCHFGSGTSNSILLATNNPVLETICVDDVVFAQNNFPHIPAHTVFIDDCVLGSQKFNTNEIVLFPNPVNNVLHFKSDSAISSIEIYNVLGQTLLEKGLKSNNEHLDVSDLTSGNYFVRVTTITGSSIFPLIKN